MQNKFNFTGEIVLPKKDSKIPFVQDRTITYTRNGKKIEDTLTTMNFGIKESDNNMAFVELTDSVKDIIKTYDTDNHKIEIDWEDRLNPDIIKTVANYRKYVVNLGDDFGGRCEFITRYDLLKYLEDALPTYKGKVLVVGDYSRSYYKGKYYDKFRVQSVYAVDEGRKNRLGLTIDFYYNKDCIDQADFKAEKKIYIDGYIQQYINNDEGNKYMPMQLVFNATKYDMENEKHKALFDYKMEYVDIKNKNMGHLAWEVVLIRGSETVEFTYDMLTEKQKQQVDLGIRELDDFKPKSNILGDKINEFRVFEPIIKDMGKDNDFSDGIINLNMKMTDFEEQIYVPNAKEEKLEDVVAKTAKTKEDADVPADESDDEKFDLF